MSPQICGYLLVLVAQYAASAAPVGAPESIELLHPKMPPAPAPSHKFNFPPAPSHGRTEAVPVIHLSTDENGKASVDAYLNMFPQELLASNKKVRPIDVRKIEHEDFIDYEIEFLELSQEIDYDENHKNLSETGDERLRDTISPMYKDISNIKKIGQSKTTNSSTKLRGDMKEKNLVTFYDLLRQVRIQHQSKISNNKQRRRRMKLKRDPVHVLNVPADTNDLSNQIDMSHKMKQEHNSHSKIKTFTNARGLLQKKNLPETTRISGSPVHRRISLPRYNNSRGRNNSSRVRKRIPIKRGRKFPHREKLVQQVTKVRNQKLISKSRRFCTEKTKSTSPSYKVVYTDSVKADDTDKSIVVTRNVTSTRLVTSASTFPMLTKTTPGLQQVTEKSVDKLPLKSKNKYLDMAATKEDVTANRSGMITRRTILEPAPKITPTSSTQLKTTNEAAKLTTLTTTIKPIQIMTRQSVTSNPRDLEQEEVKPESDDLPIETISTPFSLISLFGGKPKSSRLQIAPLSPYPQNLLETEPSFKYQEINNLENIETLPKFSLISNARTATQKEKFLKIATVSRASKFSIISTSTETSIPHKEQTINSRPIEDKVDTRIFGSSKLQAFTADITVKDENQLNTKKSVLIATNFLPTTAMHIEDQTTETNLPESSRTTAAPNRAENSTVTAVKNEFTRNKNNMQNEYKYQEVMTWPKLGSIRNDNHQVSTPSGPHNSAAALPDDLQLSESITSVYLHNSHTIQTETKNIETTENPKTESGNSITLMPYGKLANHMQETRKDSTTRQSITENIFTVTPQYFSSTSQTTEMTTRSVPESDIRTTDGVPVTEPTEPIHTTTDISDVPLETLFSGQYHEINPGQYHEVNPGQYTEQNPGQYEELHPGQYNELHPGQSGQYHNFEKSYSKDYEVNDVKVDFDHQDEHKIYNVQAKAGDFIIGEVGRIDVNNGQTLEGVRYTALEGEVDPLRISQILEKFFGAGTS